MKHLIQSHAGTVSDPREVIPGWVRVNRLIPTDEEVLVGFDCPRSNLDHGMQSGELDVGRNDDAPPEFWVT